VQAVIGAQAARPGRATLAGVAPGLSRYCIIVATPGRILVLDADRTGRPGDAAGAPPVFADIDAADATMTDATSAAA
jgi:hypothetical protein